LSRTDERRDFPTDNRVALAESDLDKLEGALAAAIEKIDTKFDKAVADLEGRLDKMQGVLVGILISLATASLLLAVNVLVGR